MNRPSSFSWRPQTTYFLIGGLVILLVALTVSYIARTFTPTTEVRLGSGVYHLQVADTEAELMQGLSGVEKLRPNGGLLMKFDSDSTWGIWMKDMKIPLDIIWLDKDKRVVYIVKNAAPELSTSQTFTPKTNARYVIELAAGAVDKAGIKTGMTADFKDGGSSEGAL